MKSFDEPTPNLIIRKMTIDDYDTLIILWKEGKVPYRPKGRDSKKNIQWQLHQPNTLYLVAEINGTVVGVILGTHDGRKGWINRLVVTPTYRKKGIAKRLVQEVELRLSDIGIDIVACLIEDWNIESKEFFKRIGYLKHTDIAYYSKRKNTKI
jgi:ribosomal protein S18 acetylase RimI-like enzyme